MNFIEKLNYLMDKNGLNKNTLSKACKIPYTTIDGWYKKGYEGLKLTTLRKLADYFGTSLDYWANDRICDPKTITNFSFTETEEQLISVYGESILDALNLYSQLDPGDQGEIRGEMKQMLKAGKYNIKKELKNA